jgi:hypothetical protein
MSGHRLLLLGCWVAWAWGCWSGCLAVPVPGGPEQQQQQQQQHSSLSWDAAATHAFPPELPLQGREDGGVLGLGLQSPRLSDGADSTAGEWALPDPSDSLGGVMGMAEGDDEDLEHTPCSTFAGHPCGPSTLLIPWTTQDLLAVQAMLRDAHCLATQDVIAELAGALHRTVSSVLNKVDLIRRKHCVRRKEGGWRVKVPWTVPVSVTTGPGSAAAAAAARRPMPPHSRVWGGGVGGRAHRGGPSAARAHSHSPPHAQPPASAARTSRKLPHKSHVNGEWSIADMRTLQLFLRTYHCHIARSAGQALAHQLARKLETVINRLKFLRPRVCTQVEGVWVLPSSTAASAAEASEEETTKPPDFWTQAQTAELKQWIRESQCTIRVRAMEQFALGVGRTYASVYGKVRQVRPRLCEKDGDRWKPKSDSSLQLAPPPPPPPPPMRQPTRPTALPSRPIPSWVSPASLPPPPPPLPGHLFSLSLKPRHVQLLQLLQFS